VTLNEIEKRLTVYSQHLGGDYGDHVLNPHFEAIQPLRPAAVLLTLINHKDGPTILFTRRTDHLADHPGQISLPGGHVDATDDGPVATALRETEEECGIPVPRIKIIGRINTYLTITGFSVTPIVGTIEPPFDMSADPVEVAEIFEVPLSFILDPSNHQSVKRTLDENIQWQGYAMPYNDYYIWGITAGILRDFYDIIDGKLSSPASTQP
jgi:8-oxo-dGTP pyrophosphatase MutT (NUDIX family)